MCENDVCRMDIKITLESVVYSIKPMKGMNK